MFLLERCAYVKDVVKMEVVASLHFFVTLLMFIGGDSREHTYRGEAIRRGGGLMVANLSIYLLVDYRPDRQAEA